MSVFKGFTQVELRKPKRSLFDLSHERRMTTRMGRLTPCFIAETIPNDTFKVNTEMQIRLAPLVAPIMHRVNAFVHYFFVPNRLLWKDWELFITNGRLGTETPPVPPNSLITVLQARGLGHLNLKTPSDYLGLNPITDAAAGYANLTIDLMPHAAFYKVWYDYYRDRNFVADDAILPLASGALSTSASLDALFSNKVRCWQHDYFTSALPWTQRGDEVLMPLIGTGSVTYLPVSEIYRDSDDTLNPAGDTIIGQEATDTAGVMRVGKTTAADAGTPGRIQNIDEVNLTSSEVSINDLRLAERLQEWLERNALAGSRYNESILAHFGRRTSDGRLQRAQYLGGGKVTIKVGEVLTTAFSDDGTDIIPPANMAGRGMVLDGTPSFKYNCEEHGFVIGIMSVMPTSGYMQGSPRMFFGRKTFLDYPFPSFAQLGEQPVHNYEIFSDATSLALTKPIFGYQSRYADWKHMGSSAHGDMRESLDYWHLTRKFASQPILSQAFVQFEDTLQDRVFAVSGVDTLWVYLYNRATVVRSLPYFGTPKL